MDVLGDENAINTTRLEVFGLGLGGEKNAGGCGPSRYCCCSSFHDSGDVAFRNGLVHIRVTKSFTLERVTVGAPNPSREPIALSFNTLAKTISKLLDLRRQAPTVQEYVSRRRLSPQTEQSHVPSPVSEAGRSQSLDRKTFALQGWSRT